MSGDQSRKICSHINDPDRAYCWRTSIWTGKGTIDSIFSPNFESDILVAWQNIENGNWKAVRLDQQSLYLNPFRINYNWPPGKFGYEPQPLKDFKSNVGYWFEKQIVRGVNLSLAYPYLAEYADYIDANPEAWRRSWLFIHTRPVETWVIVPSNKTPSELVQPPYSFPYPVWDWTRVRVRSQHSTSF